MFSSSHSLLFGVKPIQSFTSRIVVPKVAILVVCEHPAIIGAACQNSIAIPLFLGDVPCRILDDRKMTILAGIPACLDSIHLHGMKDSSFFWVCQIRFGNFS